MSALSIERLRSAASRHLRFFKNVIWQYGLQAVKYVLPLVTLPYLTRVLEPQGYAVYAYVLSYMSFAQIIVDFGFNLSGTKEIASAKTQDEINRSLAAITYARMMLCVIVGVIFAIIGCFIPIIRENAMYSLLSFIAVCGRGLAPDFLFQGKEQMGPITTRYLVSKGTSTALTFVFVRSIGDIIWIPVLDILASVIALLWSFHAAYRMFHISFIAVDVSQPFRELRVSAYYCFSNLASTTFNALATLLIGVVLPDKAQVAYWSLAMTVVTAVQALYAPIANSLYPHVVSTKNWEFAKRVALYSLPVVLLLTGGVCVFAKPIIAILGGSAYGAGVVVVELVSPVLFFSYYSLLLGWPLLGALGKVKEHTRTTVVTGLINIIMLLTLVVLQWHSVLAFAVVRSATEAILSFMRLLECRKVIREISSEEQGEGAA